MPFQIDPILFRQEEESRIKQYFNINKEKLVGFGDRQRFIDWYLHKLYIQENKCHYCKTNILDIRRLLNAGIVNGRAVRGNGLRGPNFEIDRKNPFDVYNERNCVLSCYYCNNDKSNTFSYETYLNIIGPAKRSAWSPLLAGI